MVTDRQTDRQNDSNPRCACISVTAAQTQGNLINAFLQANSLRLNADKTELLMVTKGVYSDGTHQLAGREVQVQREAKCLGVWWRYHLSPTRSVEECVHKVRRAFFALGSIGAFHGRLNTLTGRSLFETFVVSTMLYMDVRRGYFLNPTLTSLSHFKLR